MSPAPGVRSDSRIRVAAALVVVVAIVVPCASARSNADTIRTVAGTGVWSYSGDEGPATAAQLYSPEGVAIDSQGDIFIADTLNHAVRGVSGGVISTVVGHPALRPVESPASQPLSGPTALAVDGQGNLYIADAFGNSIREVAADGVIRTIAGSAGSRVGYSGDGGPAVAAHLAQPRGIAVDGQGNIFVADSLNNRVREVSGGVIRTIAGTGSPGFSGDDGPATSARLNDPTGVAVDGRGNLYIADWQNDRVREVSGGVIRTVAGSRRAAGFSGDGGPARQARLAGPTSVAVDSQGDVFFADSGNNRVREVSGGLIRTIAGNGASGHSGDGAQAAAASLGGFGSQLGVAVDGQGNLYIADPLNNRVREVSGGVVNTVAGTGTVSFSGDGGPATEAELYGPRELAVDGQGNLYIADSANNRVREVSGGVIRTIAGTGSAGFSGDGGLATAATLKDPLGVAVDGQGDIYIADSLNNRVREVKGGVISTVAGTGSRGFTGDGGPAGAAKLSYPTELALDAQGNLYIADHGNHRVREVSGGVIRTVAGTGVPGFSGDGGPARRARLNGPRALAVDAEGNLYIADFGNRRVREVSGGVIRTVAGTGVYGFSGDRGPATAAKLTNPFGVAVDRQGTLYIADSFNNRVREVSGGIITTLAGTGSFGRSGDGGSAAAAQLFLPIEVAADARGAVYIADAGNSRVRLVERT